MRWPDPEPLLRTRWGCPMAKVTAWICLAGAWVSLALLIGGAFPPILAPFPRRLQGPITVESPNGKNRVIVEATDEHATIRLIEGENVEIVGDSDKLDKILEALEKSARKGGEP